MVLFALPLCLSLAMTFTDFSLVRSNAQSVQWVGLDNWRELFADPDAANGLRVTLRFAALFVPVSLVAPVALAYLLTSERLWAKGFFRTLFFAPSAVPLVSAMIVWQFYLNDQSGWFPRMLRSIGLDPPLFLGDPDWVLPTLVMIGLWGIGTTLILYIAAFNEVPTELYEAARIDGATKWQLFRLITLPMVSPITLYNVVLTTVAIGQYFLVPFILLGPEGRPEGASQFFPLVDRKSVV